MLKVFFVVIFFKITCKHRGSEEHSQAHLTVLLLNYSLDYMKLSFPVYSLTDDVYSILKAFCAYVLYT